MGNLTAARDFLTSQMEWILFGALITTEKLGHLETGGKQAVRTHLKPILNSVQGLKESPRKFCNFCVI